MIHTLRNANENIQGREKKREKPLVFAVLNSSCALFFDSSIIFEKLLLQLHIQLVQSSMTNLQQYQIHVSWDFSVVIEGERRSCIRGIPYKLYILNTQSFDVIINRNVSCTQLALQLLIIYYVFMYVLYVLTSLNICFNLKCIEFSLRHDI